MAGGSREPSGGALVGDGTGGDEAGGEPRVEAGGEPRVSCSVDPGGLFLAIGGMYGADLAAPLVFGLGSGVGFGTYLPPVLYLLSSLSLDSD